MPEVRGHRRGVIYHLPRKHNWPNTHCITSVDMRCNATTYWLSTVRFDAINPAFRCNCTAANRASQRSITCNTRPGDDPKTEDGVSGHRKKCRHWRDHSHETLSCNKGTRLTRWISTGSLRWHSAQSMHQTSPPVTRPLVVWRPREPAPVVERNFGKTASDRASSGPAGVEKYGMRQRDQWLRQKMYVCYMISNRQRCSRTPDVVVKRHSCLIQQRAHSRCSR